MNDGMLRASGPDCHDPSKFSRHSWQRGLGLMSTLQLAGAVHMSAGDGCAHGNFMSRNTLCAAASSFQPLASGPKAIGENRLSDSRLRLSCGTLRVQLLAWRQHATACRSTLACSWHVACLRTLTLLSLAWAPMAASSALQVAGKSA